MTLQSRQSNPKCGRGVLLALRVSGLVPLLAFLGCVNNTPSISGPTSEATEVSAIFTDRTTSSGVNFTYRNGEEANHYSILESLGGGVALFDFDGDGLLDIFVTGGGHFGGPDNKQILGYQSRLYKNLGNWKFKDVTAEVGLDQPLFYTHGCAVADYDNDGWPDLLVTGWGRLVLYHNVSGGKEGRRFVDVTQQAGLKDTLWSTSAAWADLDGDGFPDLFVCHYVDWSFANHPDCTLEGKKDLCTPRVFRALPNVLYKNNRDGTFTDVSKPAGILDPLTPPPSSQPTPQPPSPTRKGEPVLLPSLIRGGARGGKSLGVVIVDLAETGKPDIYVADDAEDSLLYLNQGGMKFKEVGLERGVARDDSGTVNASMGVDAADFDGSGHFSLFVTNFQNEIHGLYRNLGHAEFVYASRRTGIASLVGLIYVGWGIGFIDFDRDGAEDIFIANGHIMRHPPPGEPLRQKPVLLRNLRKPGDQPHEVKFENVTAKAGPFFQVPRMGRGVAFGDLDNDGKIDIVVSHVNEPVVLLQNTLDNDHHWLGIQLVGKPYRDAVGAKLTLNVGNQELVRAVKGGGSYLSANDRRIIFGLGTEEKAGRLTVRWPSGQTQFWEGLTIDRYWRLVEGQADPIPYKTVGNGQ